MMISQLFICFFRIQSQKDLNYQLVKRILYKGNYDSNIKNESKDETTISCELKLKQDTQTKNLKRGIKIKGMHLIHNFP